MSRPLRGLSLIVWFATVVHAIWVTMLLWPSYTAQFATPVSGLAEIFGGNPTAACVLTISAMLGLWGMMNENRFTPLFLVPQNLLLGTSAASAVNAMATSAFADGVVRDRGFIIADQSPMVVAFIIHTLAVVALFIHYYLNGDDDAVDKKVN